MVTGLESFRRWFAEYTDQYTIIGGTACDLLMSEDGLEFRATRDIDMVLIVESLTPEFGRRFWEYVNAADYEHRNKSTGEPQFYRFSKPFSQDYPYMIELFSGRVDAIELPEDAVLTPLPLDDEISSLSAILMDSDYYQFLQEGKVVLNDIPILDAGYLIPFKAKAWLDLTERKEQGEHVDSKNIRKHKNDVFRLSILLTPDTKVIPPSSIQRDLETFFSAMEKETVDLKSFGIRSQGLKEIIQKMKLIYGLIKSENEIDLWADKIIILPGHTPPCKLSICLWTPPVIQ